MTSIVSRRSFVAATPAAVVAASLPALGASAHLDAKLLALREPYERTLAAAHAVSPAHTRAEEAVIAVLAASPERDRDEVEREVGLDVAEARWEAALDVNGEVIREIVDTPAHSLAGLICKATICEREDMHADLAESIVADLVAMGGARA